jgi:hypothetical protein
LPDRVLAEYEVRTGGSPLRVVLHKTSFFDAADQGGFVAAADSDDVGHLFRSKSAGRSD